MGTTETTETAMTPEDFGNMVGNFYFGCENCGCPVCMSESGRVTCCDCCCSGES